MRSLLVLLLAGCAAKALPPAAAATEVAVTEPTPVLAEPEKIDPVIPVMISPDHPADLPSAWKATFGHTKPFVEAIAAARGARASFDAELKSMTSTDAGAPDGKQFERVASQLELANRRYAAAYHAPDANPQNKVDALNEATVMLFGWSVKLDENGLAKAPSHYKTDPAIALTFEDVANGPAKRWREEGLALSQLCVESARTSQIDNAKTKECAKLRQVYLRAVPKKVADGGATGCACPHGDPMCSSSMSGWCHPK